jgi:hypothetical protein
MERRRHDRSLLRSITIPVANVELGANWPSRLSRQPAATCLSRRNLRARSSWQFEGARVTICSRVSKSWRPSTRRLAKFEARTHAWVGTCGRPQEDACRKQLHGRDRRWRPSSRSNDPYFREHCYSLAADDIVQLLGNEDQRFIGVAFENAGLSPAK